jgi:hypothetical protein
MMTVTASAGHKPNASTKLDLRSQSLLKTLLKTCFVLFYFLSFPDFFLPYYFLFNILYFFNHSFSYGFCDCFRAHSCPCYRIYFPASLRKATSSASRPTNISVKSGESILSPRPGVSVWVIIDIFLLKSDSRLTNILYYLHILSPIVTNE